MKSYMLRDVSDSLWKEVKKLAMKNDETIKDVIERALEAYLNGKKSTK